MSRNTTGPRDGGSAPGRDVAGRMLAVVVGLLPAERRDWGVAMRAELAGISPAAERRSFAAGCVRAAFSQAAVWRSVTSTALLVATAVAGLVLAGGLATVAIQLEMCALIVAVVGFAYAGRHVGAFGPVDSGRTARTVRTCAYVFLGFALISSVVEERLYPGNEHGMTVAFVFVIALFLVFQGTMLAATARGSRMPLGALAIGTGTGAVGGLAWFGVSMLRPVFGTSVSVPLLVAMACAVVAVAFSATSARAENVGTAAATGLAAAGSALMLISLLASAAMVAVTSKVPDIVGPVMVPGSTAAQKLREDLIEVGDTYFGVLIYGGLAFAALGILISASRVRVVASVVAGSISALVILLAFSLRWPSNIYAGTTGVIVAVVGLAVLGRRTRTVEPAPISAVRG